MASTHLAFDLGAGSGRAMLGTLAGGRLDVEEVRRSPTPLREHGERLTWDLQALWAEIRRGYERARRRRRWPACRSTRGGATTCHSIATASRCAIPTATGTHAARPA